MRCVIYTRVSTEEQGRDGASLPVQLTQCRQHAARQDWTVVEELRDIQSGLNLDRPGYQATLALARARAVDVVLVWRLDRLGRDDGEAIVKLKELSQLGIRVVSASEGEQSPFLQKLMFVMANEESRRTAERVLPSMRARAEQGLWQSRPPLGYRMVPGKAGHMAIHEGEAAIVRELYRRILGGESAYSLADWLNAQPLPPDSGLRRRPNTYTVATTIRKIITNPAYVGMVAWNRRSSSKVSKRGTKPSDEHLLVPGMHMPIVDRETFDAAQAIFARNVYRNHGNAQKGTFLLTGLLGCGVCSHRVWGQYHFLTGPKARKTYSYKCGVRGHICVSGRRVDAYVLAQVGRLSMADANLDAMRGLLERDTARQPDRTSELLAQRKRHEERRKRLTMFLADGTLTPEDYRLAIAEVEQATTTIARELTALEPRQDTAALLDAAHAWLHATGDVGAVLDAASVGERAAIVAGAVERVTLTRGSDPVITWHPWAEALLEARTASGPTG